MNKVKISTKRNYKKEPEILELSNTVSEQKTSLEEISSLFDIKQKKEAVTSKTGHWKLSSQRNKKEKMKKSEESLRDLQDTSSRTTYTLMEIQVGEESGAGGLSEDTMATILPI